MIEVYGTRWMPFDRELENCSDGAKGYGIHGLPCRFIEEKGAIEEIESVVGVRNTDGSLRLHKDDVEELFSIIITKPTIVEVVKNKKDVHLPMARENPL